MKRTRMLMSVLSCALMAGCYGSKVEVPPAHKGKVFTSAGYQPGIKHPSTFRLPFEMMTDPKLVIAEVSDQGKEEKMQVFMPEDNLILSFDVRGTYSVSDEDDKLDIIFDRLTAVPVEGNSAMMRIDFDVIYDTYAAQVIRTRCREILTRYKIEYVLKNMDAISRELIDSVRNDLKNTPVRSA